MATNRSGNEPTSRGTGKGGSIPLATLVPLRVFLGLFLLKDGLGRVGTWLSSGELGTQLARWGQDHPYRAIGGFLARCAGYGDLLAYLIAYGETALGAMLLVGLFTRAASVVAASVLVAYLGAAAGSGTAGWNATLSLVALGTLAAAGAGRVHGLDQKLLRRAPVMPFTLLY